MRERAGNRAQTQRDRMPEAERNKEREKPVRQKEGGRGGTEGGSAGTQSYSPTKTDRRRERHRFTYLRQR